VRTAGWGSLAIVSETTGFARSTINRGEDDLDTAPLPRSAAWVVAARSHRTICNSSLSANALVEPATRGDRMRPMIWASKSYGQTRSSARRIPPQMEPYRRAAQANKILAVIVRNFLSRVGQTVRKIYARDGMDIDPGLLADWIARMAWLLRPLADLIGAHVIARMVIHGDDTPVPVLAPGNGKTKPTGSGPVCVTRRMQA